MITIILFWIEEINCFHFLWDNSQKQTDKNVPGTFHCIAQQFEKRTRNVCDYCVCENSEKDII
jgi:hypothetical protein